MAQGLEQQRALAEVAIEPSALGEEHGRLVADAVEALRDPALTVRVGPLSTLVEGTFDDIVHAVQRAHRVAAASSERVVTTVRFESKRGGTDLADRDTKAAGLQPGTAPEQTRTVPPD